MVYARCCGQDRQAKCRSLANARYAVYTGILICSDQYDKSDRTRLRGIGAALVELAETVKTAYATNDADLYASTLTEDAIISMPGAAPVRGRDALKAAFESRPALPPGATFDVDPTELEIISS